MSIRGLWILHKVSPDKKSEGLLFARHYVTVERRCKLLNSKAENYVEIPDDLEFYDAIFKKLGLNRNHQEFLEQSDSCSLKDNKPVYDVRVRGGTLWPVIILEKFGLIFVCLPLVEFVSQNERPPLIELPGVSIGFTVLHNIAQLFGVSTEDMKVKVDELQRYLTLSMPFGTPLNLEPEVADTFIRNKDINWIPNFRLPAWKPVLNKAKQQISFNIIEQIKAVLYDNVTKNKNVHEVYGSISCKAELDGVPEVSLDLPSPSMDYLIVHPCVTSADSHPQSFIPSSDMTASPQCVGPSRRVQFQPSLNMFPLCHYSSSQLALPIRGIFQMKEVDELSVHLSISLKMNNNMKNNFEYFEVQIPFFNRGPALRLDYVPSVGSVVITPDQRTMVWNIGQKFPKNLEASVDVKVLFASRQVLQDTGFTEDPFCNGLNAYAKLVFKCTDFTYSGCTIDQKSIKVYPSNTKFKVSVVRTLVSSDYRIWNSHGDAIAAYFPPVVSNE